MILPKRSEVVRMLNDALGTPKVDLVEPRPSDYKQYEVGNKMVKQRELAHHWGRVELRAFLDELYGGKPKDESEEF